MDNFGLFISLEGIDGVGKTTLAKKMLLQLKEDGFDVILTREPGGTVLADAIRGILLDSSIKQSRKAQALLVLAAREDHVSNIILPALIAGKIVICDRYQDSTIAYQAANKEDIVWLEELCRIASKGLPMPKVTFLLDLEPQLCYDRKKERQNTDRFDCENDNFFSVVRSNYMYLYENNSERIKLLDAKQSEEQVFQKAYSIIKSYLDIT